MTTRFPRLKKTAGIAVMATAAGAVCLGFGSGIAQAAPKHPVPQPHSIMRLNHPRLAVTMHHQRVDDFLDRIQGHLGIGEGTMLDNRVDAFFGVT